MGHMAAVPGSKPEHRAAASATGTTTHCHRVAHNSLRHQGGGAHPGAAQPWCIRLTRWQHSSVGERRLKGASSLPMQAGCLAPATTGGWLASALPHELAPQGMWLGGVHACPASMPCMPSICIACLAPASSCWPSKSPCLTQGNINLQPSCRVGDTSGPVASQCHWHGPACLDWLQPHQAKAWYRSPSIPSCQAHPVKGALSISTKPQLHDPKAWQWKWQCMPHWGLLSAFSGPLQPMQ